MIEVIKIGTGIHDNGVAINTTINNYTKNECILYN